MNKKERKNAKIKETREMRGNKAKNLQMDEENDRWTDR